MTTRRNKRYRNKRITEMQNPVQRALQSHLDVVKGPAFMLSQQYLHRRATTTELTPNFATKNQKPKMKTRSQYKQEQPVTCDQNPNVVGPNEQAVASRTANQFHPCFNSTLPESRERISPWRRSIFETTYGDLGDSEQASQMTADGELHALCEDLSCLTIRDDDSSCSLDPNDIGRESLNQVQDQNAQNPDQNQNQEDQLSIISWNLNRKDLLNEIKTIIEKYSPDLFLLQETNLTERKSTPKIKGYFSSRKDRPIPPGGRPGGGLLTFIKNSKKFKNFNEIKIEGLQDEEAEILVTSIEASFGTLQIYNIYRNSTDCGSGYQEQIDSLLAVHIPKSAAASGRRLFSTKYPTCRQNVAIRVAQLRRYGIRQGDDRHQV